MSWDVRDDDWLAEPSAIPGSGALDEFDEQVLAVVETFRVPPPAVDQVAPPAQGSDEASEPAGERAGDRIDVELESVPPPPHSATFEPHVRPTYESGAFVADPPAEVDVPAEVATPAEAVTPAEAAEQTSSAPEAAPEDETPSFHIPTLSLGAEAAAPNPEPPIAEIADSNTNDGATDFVIPMLSRPESASTGVGASVYDDDDDDEDEPAPVAVESGYPEVIDRVDSAELELVSDEPAADEPEPAGFVIPTLARPEPDRSVEDAVIPALSRFVAAVGLEQPEEEIADADEIEEELEEVEAEAIESLDAADLVEVEQRERPAPPPPEEAAREAKEVRPPSPPPDAKPQPQLKRRKAWYDDVFAEHFLFLSPPTWDETAARDAQFMHQALGLAEGARVLDVGCGDGRHAIELAKLGLVVTGLDNSLAMLLAAAQNKEIAGLEDDRVAFMHGDMRRLPRDREFEAIICVGTTFGYFEEEQNRQCLQEMSERLVAGGKLVLHVFNRDFVAPHLPSRSWWQGRRCMVIDEAEMNFFASRLRVHRTVIFDDGRQYEHFMFLRAYTVQDLGKAISAQGMRVLEVSGSRDTRGRFYGSASPDIWIVAERK